MDWDAMGQGRDGDWYPKCELFRDDFQAKGNLESMGRCHARLRGK
jgi:hypothetical protein